MRKGLIFYNVIEFFENKDKIKEIYQELSIDEIEYFKLYVYALPYMEENVKDLIWEWLNSNGEVEIISDLGKYYGKAKRKLENRKKYAVFNPNEII